MKIIRKNRLSIFFSVLLLFSLASCSKKIQFLTSSVVPAARGSVKMNHDKNNNYVIQIQLFDLAEVQRLQPSRQSYVIWMVSDRGSPKNIGQIKSSKGNMSKSLKASFETVSSFKPNKIFITAEDDPNVRFPDTLIVLTTDEF